MQISDNTVVSIHYTLKNSKGELIDSSETDHPLTYLHGAGNIIPGLEQALTGKTTGEKLQVKVDPEQAYGHYRKELTQKVSIDHFKNIQPLEVGMRFRAESDSGERLITITDIGKSEVTVDANHPMAGQTLHFNVEIVDLREATEEEIEHGHAHHADNGHQH